MPSIDTVSRPLSGSPRYLPYSVTSACDAPWGQRPDTSRNLSASPWGPPTAIPSTVIRRSPIVVRPLKLATGTTGAPTRRAMASALSNAPVSRSRPGIGRDSPGTVADPWLGSAPWTKRAVSGPSRSAWPLPIVYGMDSTLSRSSVVDSVTTRLSSSVGTATMTTISALRPLCRRTSRRAIRRATAQLERHAAYRLGS